MFRIGVTLLGKFLLFISPMIWKLRGDIFFRIHQRIGVFVITINHRYNLDLFTGDDD